MGAELAPWWERIACYGVDPSMFESRDGEITSTPPERVLQANETYCQRCTVRKECGDDATDKKAEGLRGGIWRYRDKVRRRYQVREIERAAPPARVEENPKPGRYPCPVCARAVGAPWGALAIHKHQGRACAGSGDLLDTAVKEVS